mgnify:CR=1 FL=1
MNKTEFRKLFDDKILILDGATGTNLMDAGLPLSLIHISEPTRRS